MKIGKRLAWKFISFHHLLLRSFLNVKENQPVTKAEARNGPPGALGTGKRAKKTARNNAKLKAFEDQIKSNNRHPSTPSSSSLGRGGKGGGKDHPARPRQVPDQEWQSCARLRADSKFCNFYNMSCGCTIDTCRLTRHCPFCSEEHRWVDRHY